MAPSLQGLNVVHPVQPSTDSHDLLAGQSYPDLSAQLDLWTNLAFECDEGPLGSKNDDEKYGRRSRSEEEEDESLTSHGSSTREAAIHDGHINVGTGTLGAQHPSPPALDLNAVLAGFGIDPFAAPPVLQNQNQNPQPAPGIAPSLAQLLAHYTAPGAPLFAPPPPAPTASASASPATSPAASSSSLRRSTDDTSSPSYAPPAKRQRARKSSVSTASTADAADSPEDAPIDVATAQAIAAAEDKRRRNTAASARFRLKKKEREAALEGKAKELETRVNELERECEGLRRENGWLKGLVVGVTGAAQQGPSVVNVGTKRTRDEAETA
ncbi:putative basic region leucine zipper [Lyophyllum shimeji]|uniref:Basic region leucine zipper n=1 Tax=Lyophyllum shimeji TaxID=47721 RepID=A0A9P3ULY7_LYOSH|nr:putative basic region leucine zipper [Lyophyllum shimeji]